MPAIGTRYDYRELQEGLKRSEKVVYTENGNRALDAEAALRLVMPALARAGVTRLAEISQLTPGRFPVFQSSRPGIYLHSCTGQNTGAQGKGITRAQAKISCAMESIEKFCMEPRNETLIRGSYDFLRHHHAILPPWGLPIQDRRAKPSPREPFMWTSALLLDSDEAVLIPAEAVYFPFLPRDYNTRPAFLASSNGVAAGSTYLEATVHALYELIERHYFGLWVCGKIRAHALRRDELDALPNIREFRDATRDEFAMEILALRLKGLRNLPMFVCWLVGPNGNWLYGCGCAPNLNMALHRAMSEAVQAYAVFASGTREDLDTTKAFHSLRIFPRTQTLLRHEYLKTAHDEFFHDLRDEVRFLVKWLKRAGYPVVTVANLTRRGLDVPVVKAVVPRLSAQTNRSYGLHYTTPDIRAKRFRFKRTKQ